MSVHCKPRQKSSAFLKKSSKKLLSLWVAGFRPTLPQVQIHRSFCAAFFKKRLLVRVSLLLAALACSIPAPAAKLDRAQRNLDAANQAASRHAEAAATAQRAIIATRARKSALVAREVAANAALRIAEDNVAQLTDQITDLAAKTSAARTELDADAAAIAPLLPLITRLALHPAQTLLAADAAPGRAAEGALVMQGLTRQIAARATALREARRRYATLSQSLTAQQTALAQSVAAEQTQAASLQTDIAAVSHAEAVAISHHRSEARAATYAARRAHDLVGLIDRLHRERRDAAAAVARAQQAAARIPLPKSLHGAPVAGKLTRTFGAATAAGPATGDTFAALPGATVSASCAGSVVFAKPFGSYGNLLILDCGDGYDFVMGGLGSFDVHTGQSVAVGQPVGAMAASEAKPPSLYVELRHHGTPIDPAQRFPGR